MLYQGIISGDSFNDAKINAENLVRNTGFSNVGKAKTKIINGTRFEIGKKSYDLYDFSVDCGFTKGNEFKLFEVAKINVSSGKVTEMFFNVAKRYRINPNQVVMK